MYCLLRFLSASASNIKHEHAFVIHAPLLVPTTYLHFVYYLLLTGYSTIFCDSNISMASHKFLSGNETMAKPILDVV